MKKFVVLICAVCFLCFSCSKNKDHSTNPEAKQYKLTFNLNGFTPADTAFQSGTQIIYSAKTTNSTAATGTLDILYCNVYDSNGNSVSTTQQLAKDADFGAFTLNLSAGNYTIVFAGGKDGLKYSNPLSPNTGTLNTDLLTYQNDYVKDTFYKKISVTVNNDNVQSVTLSRIVSQLVLVVQDVLPPADMSFVLLKLTEKTSYCTFQVNSGKLSRNAPALTDTVPIAKLGKSNYTVKKLVLTDPDPFQLFIEVYRPVPFATTYQYVTNRTLTNVTAQANKSTIVSTKLFDHLGDPSTTPVLTH